MSQSPDSVSDTSGIAEYGNSWKETIKMVRNGTSWSGRERNCVYLNVGETSSGGTVAGNAASESALARFANVSSISGVDFPDDARAMAITDWDQDGDLDIWLRNRTAPRLRLLLNGTNESSRNNFISIKLVGVECNPEAIGAVVTFHAKGIRPVMQSVRAGDAFVSQSSRWLHFGVSQLGSVDVQWPGGKIETFAGLSTGNRYELKQGTGTPTRQQAKKASKPLVATTLEPLPATDAARIILPARLPFPPLESSAEDLPSDSDHKKVLDIPKGAPTLVTFWTSTCPNCRSELQEFVESKDRLQSHGLNVVAINIDNLQESDVNSEFDVASLSENLRQQTTQASIATLNDLQQSLFDKYPPFVVPLSFLLDSQGNIGIIYRGAVGLDTVFEDTTILSRPNTELRNLASPFAGTWFTKPASTSEFIEYVAKRLYTRDQDLGLHYFEMALEAEAVGPRKSRLSSQLVLTYRKLGRSAGTAGKHRIAESHLRRALHLSNRREKPAIHHDLGVLFASAGNYAEAEKQFLQTLQLQPNFPNAQKNLDLVLRKKSQ